MCDIFVEFELSWIHGLFGVFLFFLSSLENFCTEGVGLLKSLIQSRHLRAAVHLLDSILPPTYPLSFYLLNNSQ